MFFLAQTKQNLGLGVVFLIIAASFLFMPKFAQADTEVSGQISIPTTWNLAGSPYIVTNDITVIPGASLTIEAGVEVRFNKTKGLVVQAGAAIDVQGQLGTPVVFTSNEAQPTAGDWGGIQIEGNGRSDTSSNVQHAEFYYAHGVTGTCCGGGTWTLDQNSPAALQIVNASPDIKNCLFDSNVVGLTIRGRSDSQVHDNNFNRNIYAPISIIPDANPDFQNIIYGTGGLANANEAIGLGVSMYSRTGLVEDGRIRQIDDIYRGSTANPIDNIPYMMVAGFTVDDVELTIDPRVVIKMGPNDPRPITLINGESYDAPAIAACWYTYLFIKVLPGGSITAVGSPDAPIVFTSTYDDARGGDTNLDGSATLADAGDWHGVHILGNGRSDTSSTIQYAEFYYATWLDTDTQGVEDRQAPAVKIVDASPLIQNCLFDSNLVGLTIRGRSDPQIYDNTFYRNIYAPISIIPDANPDFQNITYGTGAKANAFEAMGLGTDPLYGSYTGPVEDARITQINDIYRDTGEQIFNIAYVLVADFSVDVDGVNLTIDRGIVIKTGPHDPRSITLENGQVRDAPQDSLQENWIWIHPGASITAIGTEADPIIFTSTYDDTRGEDTNKDTNLDGGATIPSLGSYSGQLGFAGIHILGNGRSDTSSTIQYTEFYYGNWRDGYWGEPASALEIRDASPLIQNCLFDSNLVGIIIWGASDPQIRDSTFYRNVYAPITLIPDANPSFHEIIYGAGAQANAFEAIGLGIDPDHIDDGLAEDGRIRQINDIYQGSVSPENQIDNIPYVLITNLKVDDVNLTIDPGVVIKMGPPNPREITLENGENHDAVTSHFMIADDVFGPYGSWIKILPGGSITAIGTPAQPIIFTSTYDDARGGDTNLDGSATLADAGYWGGLHIFGNGSGDSSSTVQYAEFYYAHWAYDGVGAYSMPALEISDASPLIQNCLFDSNLLGLVIRGDSDPQIWDNTFYRNIVAPMTLIPDANPDFQNIIYGTEAQANAFEAIGLGIFPRTETGPIKDAHIYQTNEVYQGSVAPENQINNIPYVLVADFRINNGITLTIDPGVVIKMGPHDPRAITLENGQNYDCGQISQVEGWIRVYGSLNINGADCLQVSFTSTYDDAIGGDTNLDGSATSPSPGIYRGIVFEDNSSANITYTEFLYGGGKEYWGTLYAALKIHSSSVTIQRASFRSNTIGIYIAPGETPVLNLSEIDFAGNNTYYGLRNDGTSIVEAQDFWWGSDNGPAHPSHHGRMLVIFCPGDTESWWIGGTREYAPIIYQPSPGGDFTIETKLENYSVNDDTFAGIMLYSDRDNAYLWGRYRNSPSNNGLRVHKIFNNGNNWPWGGYTAVTTLPIWLRIRVEGGVGYFEYSTNGSDWTEQYNESLSFNPTSIGLFAQEWGGSSSLIEAPFNYFRMGAYIDNFDDGSIGGEWTTDIPAGSVTESQTDYIGIGDRVSDNVNFEPFAENAWGLCAPDQPYNLGSTLSSRCALVPLVDLSWTYSEQTGSPQKGYRIEIDSDSAFNDPVLWRSCEPELYCVLEGTTVPESFTISAPTGIIEYGYTYYWRIRVFDQELETSVWTSGNDSFTTAPYAGPQPSRTFTPENPLIGSQIDFVDTSTCYDFGGSYECRTRFPPDGTVTYYWDFDDGVGTSTEVDPSYTYDTSGTYSVLQEVTDESGIMCGDRFDVSVGFGLPKWKEISPF